MEVPEIPAETKDPSGGTTGRVKLYGRLGWMGARAEYSLDGEGLPLPLKLVAAGVRHVQNLRRFFSAFGGCFRGEHQSVIRKSGHRFSVATNAKRLRGDHAQAKRLGALLRGGPISLARSRFVGCHGGCGLVEGPGRGNLLPV